MPLFIAQTLGWRDGDRLAISLNAPLPPPPCPFPAETRRFWPTFQWADNSWIRDGTGNKLTQRKYDRIRSCVLADLEIERTGPGVYSFRVPLAPGAPAHHSDRKLMRWALAIVFGSPTLRIAEKCEVQSAVTLRQQPELRVPYSWFVMDAGTVHGVSTLSTGLTQGTIVLHRQPDGFHWTIAETSVTYSDGWSDIKVLHQAQRDNGLVVAAHPAIHGFPWVVP
uniref:Uncharacterized protein n=1 Tax=Peronospora matthiolae TaxID=2874970 RepID=A0AAV1TVA9_9STRA